MNIFFLQASANPLSENAKAFSELDPHGFTMTIIAMTVVFSALLLLYFVFKNMSRLFQSDGIKKNAAKKAVAIVPEHSSEEVANEEYAAIALALHLYRSQMHDMENTIITIQKVAKTYSPWSSKIYGLRRDPKKQ